MYVSASDNTLQTIRSHHPPRVTKFGHTGSRFGSIWSCWITHGDGTTARGFLRYQRMSGQLADNNALPYWRRREKLFFYFTSFLKLPFQRPLPTILDSLHHPFNLWRLYLDLGQSADMSLTTHQSYSSTLFFLF